MVKSDSCILIVGHGAVENSLVDYFKRNGFTNVHSTTSLALNPTIQASVYAFFQDNKPDYVFLGSTKSGGIQANIDNPGEFFYHNSESQNNVLHAAVKFGVKKLIYYGGSCIYPKECVQPIKEDSFLTGPLEKTSEPYSVAKIAGVVAVESFKKQFGLNAVAMVPATIYGPGCDTDLESAHVLGALLAKFSEAASKNKSEVEVWGTGEPRRELIFVDDFVEASLFLMNNHEDITLLNAGCGEDISIKELAEMIGDVVEFKGKIKFDSSKPDGVKQKLLDSSKINKLGWCAKTSLRDGIKKTYQWYSNREAVV